MNLFMQLRPQWHESSLQDLLGAPVTALKVVDEARAAALDEVLGVHTVGEMVTHPLVDWVWRTVRRFRAGAQSELPADAAEHVSDDWLQRPCADWLAAPLSSLKAIDDAQQRRLAEALGWATVRHMATDPAFEVAREISRLATGKPVPPEAALPKSAPDYFAGGTQRFLAKVRESAGLPQQPPAPPPPPPPPQRGAGQQPAPPELAVEGELAPAVLATLHPGPASSIPRITPHPHRDYTEEGTYIPRSGGSRGWVDNAAVSRSEQPNHYRYREAVDAERFRRASLEERARGNRIGTVGKAVRQQVRWSLQGETGASPGVCLNLSLTAAQLRLSQALSQDATLDVTWVHRDEVLGTEIPLVAASARVAWCQRANVGQRVPRYDCGIEFGALSPDAQRRLSLLLDDRTDELLQRGGPEPLPES